MKKIKIKQKDIWDATRPNVYANKKKYKRKAKYGNKHDKRRPNMDDWEEGDLF